MGQLAIIFPLNRVPIIIELVIEVKNRTSMVLSIDCLLMRYRFIRTKLVLPITSADKVFFFLGDRLANNSQHAFDSRFSPVPLSRLKKNQIPATIANNAMPAPIPIRIFFLFLFGIGCDGGAGAVTGSPGIVTPGI